ncbi:MAG: hypothetical protein QXH30_02675 [Candidatus Bilamarchaeaceae archaeon]
MDKGLIVKVLVVGLALLFLLEPFAMTVSNWAGIRTNEQNTQYFGTANVNITVYSYGAFLFASGLGDMQKAQIMANPEVLEVSDLEGGNVRITLRDSAKAREVHAQLKNIGINTVSIMQVGLPEEYELALENGSMMKIHGGYYQMFMEPAIEPGHSASFLIAVEASGNSTYRILQARMYYYETEISAQGVVVGEGRQMHSYIIPWEERATVDVPELAERFGKENVEYARKDYFSFNPPLSAEETISAKKEYMTFISETSASVRSDFTNKTQVEEEFGERAVFPSSILTISARERPVLDSNYTYEKTAIYSIRFPEDAGGYYLATSEALEVPSEKELADGERVSVRMNITATGNSIIAIKGIAIEGG